MVVTDPMLASFQFTPPSLLSDTNVNVPRSVSCQIHPILMRAWPAIAAMEFPLPVDRTIVHDSPFSYQVRIPVNLVTRIWIPLYKGWTCHSLCLACKLRGRRLPKEAKTREENHLMTLRPLFGFRNTGLEKVLCPRLSLPITGRKSPEEHWSCEPRHLKT